ncbi:hypothetical protein C0J52_24558 [Blattella germanica]|nr:hypothetical protein C0J52_24558 [Blattella germanica]
MEYLQIKSYTLRWAGHVAQLGNERGEKHPVGRPRMKWKNNYTGDDWKTLTQDRP